MSPARKPTSTFGLESAHAMALIQWADTMARSTLPVLRFLHHIPNGGARSKATAGRMKAEGVRSGVWDYLLPVRADVRCIDGSVLKTYGGLYIELKDPRERRTKNGGLSDNQVDFGEYVYREGFATVVAYDWTEAQQAILAYVGGHDVPFFWTPKVQHVQP